MSSSISLLYEEYVVLDVGMMALLIILCLEDIKGRSVSLVACILTVVIGMFTTIANHKDFENIFTDGVISMLPGLIMLVLSVLSSKSIGSGDGLIILGVGLWLGMTRTMEVVLLALLCGCIFSAILMMCKKVDRKYEIPFVPFITMGVFVTKVGEFI